MAIDGERLSAWNDDGKYQKVIDAVEALPLAERAYEIVSQYARALNSRSRYDEAIVQLDAIRDQAESDAFWYYRYGYSLYYLDREAESIPYFERAIELGDDYPDTYEILEWARVAAGGVSGENDDDSEGSDDEDGSDDFEPQAFATLSINMRIGPEDRYECVERAIELFLQAKGIGRISGGGTLVNEYGEPESCDIEIDLKSDTDEVREALITAASRLSVAKGSKLIYRSAGDGAERAEYPIGKMEGLAIYLNLQSVPDYIFETYSVAGLVHELNKLLSEHGALIRSHCETAQGLAVYYYREGEFDDIYARVAPFIKTYPICDKSRVVELGVEDGKEFLIDVALPPPPKHSPTNLDHSENVNHAR